MRATKIHSAQTNRLQIKRLERSWIVGPSGSLMCLCVICCCRDFDSFVFYSKILSLCLVDLKKLTSRVNVMWQRGRGRLIKHCRSLFPCEFSCVCASLIREERGGVKGKRQRNGVAPARGQWRLCLLADLCSLPFSLPLYFFLRSLSVAFLLISRFAAEQPGESHMVRFIN